MIFTEFVKQQVERLGSIADFSMKISMPGQMEITEWLIAAANESSMKRKRSGQAEWLRESEPARRVKAVIDECVEFESAPGLADIRAVWRRVNPPKEQARNECPRCQGTGFIVVDGPYGTSAAYPCSHKPETDADRRMGVRIAPAVEGRYKREAVEAAARYRAGYKNLSAGDRGKFMAPAGVPQAILDAIGETE